MNYLKTILMALLGKYAKAHSKEIAKAQKWIDSAQSSFATALEEAELSEKKVDAVIEEAQAKIAELENVIREAEAKKSQAVSFKNKINEFLK
ncbi:hypothetical protein [Bacillus gaemokensis]|uniref:Uncharacterized protein n=1 Tax=Bacillus gaemokensis TaxID=574375 RepID=A0A073K9L6_9BACI|nr:hypothetical protein [Bacillus gaemokensis]KEK23959.1 hypothetical protein BAGA_05985 [Bacillus gaemokensis]KYG38080.1 hypothetical protein AZF08_20215 [Bacillus gaemokensis]